MDRIVALIKKYVKTNRDINSDTIKRIVLIAILIPLGLVAFAVNSSAGSEDIPEEEPQETEATVSDNIYIDIGGAVNEPMLAELPQGSRVEDAIVAAGGLTKDADISSINRAEFLEDGEKVYIPEINDEEPAQAGYGSADGSDSFLSASPDASSGGKININSADSTQLQELNGVGPATAQKIIDYRTANGRFKTIEDIKNVSGIGDKTFEKLKDHITI